MWVIKGKKRKSDKIIVFNTFDKKLIAEAALDALKAGFGSRFIQKNFTYLKIEKL